MRITIDIDGQPVEFQRNWFTGSTTLRVAGAEQQLQDPLDPSTHFALRLTQRWQCRVASHAVVIEKQRPRMFAGFRPQTYRILVDGKLVAEQTGY
jgi:hypothetical protein